MWLPVVPDVKQIMARSSGLGACNQITDLQQCTRSLTRSQTPADYKWIIKAEKMIHRVVI